MKFSCTQENLSQGLQIVSHIATKNISLPILSNVLIKIDNKELKLITTNLEIAITCRIRAKVEKDGDYTVPAQLFNEYLSVISGNRVDIESKPEGINVSTDDDKTMIKGNKSTDFPLIPRLEKNNFYGILVNDLKNTLQQLMFAVSKNEARPELTGVLFHFNPEYKQGFLICAATDSYRLAEKSTKLMNSANYSQAEKKVIVPVRVLQEVSRIISSFRDDVEEELPVEITVADNQIMFSYGPVEIISRLIEGQYPDYRQIIPQNFKTEINFSAADWMRRIKAASFFSNIGINGINIVLKSGAEQKATFTSTNGQLGDHNSQTLCKINGEDNQVLINYRYLLDGLSNLGSENGVLKLISPESPCVLEAKDKPDYLYIIMPIKQ